MAQLHPAIFEAPAANSRVRVVRREPEARPLPRILRLAAKAVEATLKAAALAVVAYVLLVAALLVWP